MSCKAPRRNWKNILDIGIGNSILGMTPKTQATKEKNRQVRL